MAGPQLKVYVGFSVNGRDFNLGEIVPAAEAIAWGREALSNRLEHGYLKYEVDLPPVEQLGAPAGEALSDEDQVAVIAHNTPKKR